MKALRAEIPPRVADAIRELPPEIKRAVRAALQAILVNPRLGEPLRRELQGLWKYRIRRYRITYAVDRRRRLRVLAVGRRSEVYGNVERLLASLDPGA